MKRVLQSAFIFLCTGIIGTTSMAEEPVGPKAIYFHSLNSEWSKDSVMTIAGSFRRTFSERTWLISDSNALTVPSQGDYVVKILDSKGIGLFQNRYDFESKLIACGEVSFTDEIFRVHVPYFPEGRKVLIYRKDILVAEYLYKARTLSDVLNSIPAEGFRICAGNYPSICVPAVRNFLLVQIGFIKFFTGDSELTDQMLKLLRTQAKAATNTSELVEVIDRYLKKFAYW